MYEQRFDDVVGGAGTAGSLLANRLSADSANRVLRHRPSPKVPRGAQVIGPIRRDDRSGRTEGVEYRPGSACGESERLPNQPVMSLLGKASVGLEDRPLRSEVHIASPGRFAAPRMAPRSLTTDRDRKDRDRNVAACDRTDASHCRRRSAAIPNRRRR